MLSLPFIAFVVHVKAVIGETENGGYCEISQDEVFDCSTFRARACKLGSGDAEW